MTRKETLAYIAGFVDADGYWNKNSKLFDWQEGYSKKFHVLNKRGI